MTHPFTHPKVAEEMREEAQRSMRNRAGAYDVLVERFREMASYQRELGQRAIQDSMSVSNMEMKQYYLRASQLHEQTAQAITNLLPEE